MANTANPQAYGSNPWGPPGGTGPGYQPHPQEAPPFWAPTGLSRTFGIVAMILGFVFFWPIGLAMLFLMKWSGHMGCWGRRQRAMYGNGSGQGPFQGWTPPWKAWNCQPQNGQATATGTPSGNRAFDEYREATLRRLEEEQKEFGSFLERLRFAKDKAEFDQFMAERRERPAPQPENPMQAG